MEDTPPARSGKPAAEAGSRHTGERLRAACMALGLARLQLRAGRVAEAETALSQIHEDIQVLRHCLDGPGKQCPKPRQRPRRACGA
jgi:hypothetical protein